MKIHPEVKDEGFNQIRYLKQFIKYFLDLCGEEKKITIEKRILLDTIKEYSDHTTIHGINYVFASFLSFNDRLFWFIIFITGLALSVFLSLDAFLDWRKNMIVTRFENSELPVTEIEFPAVTICSQGLTMENVARAVERDFYQWHVETREQGDRSRRETIDERMSEYLREKFDIGDGDPGLLEIIQSMTSVGGATAIMAESLTKNVKKCSEKTLETSQQEQYPDISDHQQLHLGSNCPLMDGFRLSGHNSTLQFSNLSLPQCSQLCHDKHHCFGYNFNKITAQCSFFSSFGRFIKDDNTVSGRKCTNCQILEKTKLTGPVLETALDLSLDDCINLCNSRSICSYFTYYYSKLISDTWSKCVLLHNTKEEELSFTNGNFVIRKAVE